MSVSESRIAAADLNALATTILGRFGSLESEAEVVASHLVNANLRGHDSHGVSLLPLYAEAVMRGALKPNTRPIRISDSGSILIFDGARGFGHVSARDVTLDIIQRARDTGVAVGGLRNAGHIGRVGAYGELVAEAGMIGIFLVNAIGRPPIVAPFGGREARFSTNPFCIAVPIIDGWPPIILDFATSKIALGKARVAHERGEKVPEGCLIDDSGLLTTEPRYALESPFGALLAFGDYKGSGLAIMCDLVAGALLAGDTAESDNDNDEMMTNNMFVVVVDPNCLSAGIPTSLKVASLLKYIKSSAPLNALEPVRLPGEVEAEAMIERYRGGIPIDNNTLAVLQALALQ